MSNITTPNGMQIFESVKEHIKSIATKCSDFVIHDLTSLGDAKTLAKDAKKIENLIEDKRKELTQPLLTEQRNIKAFADSLVSELNSSVKGLRQQILDFEMEQERIRREEQARLEKERREKEEELRRQAEELQKKLAEETKIEQNEVSQLEKEIAELDRIKEQAKEVATPISKNIRMVWDFEITNPNLIPREYLVVDEKAIRTSIINNGTREIPGVRIFQKEQLNLR